MKKHWWIVGVLALALSACTAQTETPDLGLYLPGSFLEVQTAGAVKGYPLPEAGYDALVPTSDGGLLLRGSQLQRLQGETLAVAGQWELPGEVICADESGLICYGQETKSLVFFGVDMKEMARLQLPEETVGVPCLSENWEKVYYCTCTGVFQLDMHTGITRLLRQQENPWQTVSGVYRNGTVLRCEVKTAEGKTRVQFFSTEDGGSLYESESVQTLVTWGDAWYLSSYRSCVPQYLVGMGEQTYCLWPVQGAQSTFVLTQQNVIMTVRQIDNGVVIDGYQLPEGNRKWGITLSGVADVRSLQADGSGRVLFLAKDIQTGKDLICKWDFISSPVIDETSYLQPYYTQQNWDEKALETVKAEFTELGNAYNVNFLLWQEAMNQVPDGYEVAGEYLAQAYAQALSRLKTVLSGIPKEILENLGDGAFTVCLVRDLEGEPGYGTPANPGCVQYWQNGQPYLVLAMGQNMELDFYRGLYYAMEYKMLSTNSLFYEWNTLNPEGFVYDGNYKNYESHEGSPYLQETQRAFADSFSMTYPREDRASLFAHACVSGNGALFGSQIMQVKLQLLCRGIDMVFQPVGAEQPFPWEQYLRIR